MALIRTGPGPGNKILESGMSTGRGREGVSIHLPPSAMSGLLADRRRPELVDLDDPEPVPVGELGLDIAQMPALTLGQEVRIGF